MPPTLPKSAAMQALESALPDLAALAGDMGPGEGAPAQFDQEQAALFGVVIKKAKDEAVKFRKNSGIEAVWLAAEEAYAGIDDANRHEFTGAAWCKPATMDGPLTRSVPQRGDQIRSTVFVHLTSRYVETSAAKVAKIILPVDGKAFSGKPTPLPELIQGTDDDTHVTGPDGNPMFRPPEDGEDATHALPDGSPAMPVTADYLAKQRMAEATEKAEKAEKRIYDWMVECGHHSEMRRVIDDAARIGTGLVKGVVPTISKQMAVTKSEQEVSTGVKAIKFGIEVREEIKPGHKWIDPWNFFPAPGCGENIHNGNYACERDFLSDKGLEALKGEPGYLADQIDKVLEEGPNKSNTLEGRNPHKSSEEADHQYEVWYFTGSVKREDLASVGADLTGIPEEKKMVPAVVTLVNDTVIRAHVSLLDSGELTYHVFNWTRRAGSWAGVGVAEKLRTPQREINGATRSLLDNAGLSAGGQIVVDQVCISPADGSWTLTPNKIWLKNADASADDVRKAFEVFRFPDGSPQLMGIINMALRTAEESAALPLISQGHGSDNPTLGQDEIQNENANTLLESIAKRVDDGITAPLVKQYYEWLILDPDVPDDEKGDWTWECNGSVALVQRAIQTQALMALLPLSKDPTYEINPAKLMRKILASKYINPDEIGYDDAELESLKSQPQQTAPAIEVAQIRAQTAKDEQALKERIAQMEAQIEQYRIKRDTDRDTIFVQAQDKKTQNQMQLAMEELQLRERLAILDYANREKMTIEKVKADLQAKVMSLEVQKELSAAADAMDLHKHYTPPQVATPVVEPASRAENGQAFAQ